MPICLELGFTGRASADEAMVVKVIPNAAPMSSDFLNFILIGTLLLSLLNGS